MKIFNLLFAILLCLGVAFEANAQSFSSSQIKRYVDKTPRDVEDNLSSLAKFLTKPFDNDYDKAKAISYWIASRISYDEYLYNNGKISRLIKNYDGQEPSELLRSRVGICGDFARLFEALCRKSGIKAYSVRGYAYPVGQSLTASNKRNSGHVWNYFNFGRDKIFVDTTFMAKGTTGVKGSINNLNRRRTLQKIKRQNRKKSVSNDFDEFYFDFKYKDEKQYRKYQRKER